jgi:two-component system cell cycle sensor histidine kinase/response regulator CckA
MMTYLGQTPGKKERIELSETCSRSLPLIQTAGPKNMLLKADFPVSGPVIRANASQIMQVLTNLVTNSWESAAENRRGICLTVKTVCAADIPVSPRFPIDWQARDPIYACLEVADAGCGISENDIEKIFDPFFSTKFTGRGLGLSVVLGIVRAHQGVVTVESEPERGSIFRVFIPVLAEKILSQPDKEVNPPEKEDRGTVLLVEDAEMVLKMIATWLTHLGFKVLEARDGVDAVEVFRQHRNEIRCVLSDLAMPRMDGWETLAVLRKLSPDIPVILSSGYDETRVMAGEHPERPNAFLGKPYRLLELRNTILRMLADQGKCI